MRLMFFSLTACYVRALNWRWRGCGEISRRKFNTNSDTLIGQPDYLRPHPPKIFPSQKRKISALNFQENFCREISKINLRKYFLFMTVGSREI